MHAKFQSIISIWEPSTLNCFLLLLKGPSFRYQNAKGEVSGDELESSWQGRDLEAPYEYDLYGWPDTQGEAVCIDTCGGVMRPLTDGIRWNHKWRISQILIKYGTLLKRAWKSLTCIRITVTLYWRFQTGKQWDNYWPRFMHQTDSPGKQVQRHWRGKALQVLQVA